MTQTYTPPAPATSGTLLSLWWGLLMVWAAFTLGAVGFVAMIGTNAPYADEWEFVPALLGEEPVLPWLWQQHNEHRLPLPRLIFFVLFQLTHDFRAGMLLQVAMLSGLALYLMRLAAQLRGKPHWADAFFPISLLHIGHWENFVMGYQLCFALFCVLVTALAVIALRITRENAFRSGVVASLLLLLIALTGGSGLAVVLPVVVWLLFVAVGIQRRGRKDRAALLVLLALLPVVYLGVYFVDYHKPPGHPDLTLNPLAVGPVTAAVLALAPGVGLSGIWWAVCVGEVLLGVCTIVLLVRRGRSEALSTVGLLAVAAGVAGVAFAIGSGRAEWGVDRVLGFARYSLLVWPLLAMVYLVWVKLGRKWVPIVLCVVAAIAFPTNTGTGMLNGAAVKSNYSAIAADTAVGLSAEQIVKKDFPNSFQAGQQERAIRAIPMLRKAQIGIFAGK